MSNAVMKPGNSFEKGKSGNPGGRKKTPEDVKRLLRENCYAAVEAIIDIMNDPKSPPSVRLAAAQAIADRQLGKPTQHVESTAKVEHKWADLPDELRAQFASLYGVDPTEIGKPTVN